MAMQDYAERGTWTTLGAGVQAYVAQQPHQTITAGLLVIADIFGVHSGRHRAICDQLADEIPGLLVVMPDIFNGDELVLAPRTDGIGCCLMCQMTCKLLCCCKCSYMKAYSWESKQQQMIMDAALPYIMAAGAKLVGTLGFCFGTYAVLHAGGSEMIHCGIAFHPALDGSMGMCAMTGDEKDGIRLCTELKSPLLVVHTQGDIDTWEPTQTAHKAADSAITGNIWEHTDQLHGFMSRGDIHDSSTKEAVNTYFEATKKFIHAHLFTNAQVIEASHITLS